MRRGQCSLSHPHQYHTQLQSHRIMVIYIHILTTTRVLVTHRTMARWLLRMATLAVSFILWGSSGAASSGATAMPWAVRNSRVKASQPVMWKVRP